MKIEKLTENAKGIKAKKPKNAPKRSIMPQPSDTADAVGMPKDDGPGGMPAEFVDTLKSGQLNFKEPITTDDFLSKESKKWVMTYEQFKSKK